MVLLFFQPCKFFRTVWSIWNSRVCMKPFRNSFEAHHNATESTQQLELIFIDWPLFLFLVAKLIKLVWILSPLGEMKQRKWSCNSLWISRISHEEMHKTERYSCIYRLAFFGITYYEIGFKIQIIWWDKNVAFILWYQSVSIQNLGVAYVPKKKWTENNWNKAKWFTVLRQIFVHCDTFSSTFAAFPRPSCYIDNITK